ncbi:ECF transporter S component [Sedimentibacter sp. MB31-C6]|uniref:ECF transporter S component n=1 Tax=Sedimentibacter sp. MB31-C6 TaxID=3109366 RepID=UPI002DDD1DAE|nr:ECF transporter S component [Sedimentibacter sp. MB36-C1]WSI02925.1 ECF transporter S component [Sedimentibacter sp. MB36-C1]
MENKFLKNYTLFNLIIIAIVSALGIATKPIVVPLVHIITGPLFIPGGAIAGGFYMFWVVLGTGIVKKTGTGTLIGIVQGILVIATGTMGTHGVMSLISYTLPGITVDIVFLFSKNKKYNSLHYILGCTVANITGTLISNILFFRLPLVTVVLILSVAALSGIVGGIIAYSIAKGLEKMNILEE